MELYEEFTKIIKGFNKNRIKYAVIGGFAMGFYDNPRFTKDIDILTISTQVEKIKRFLLSIDFEEAAPPWMFKTSKLILHRFGKIENDETLMLDILIGEDEFYKKVIVNALGVKSENGIVKIATKEDLIKLKLKRNSDQDKIDIKRLKKS